MYVFCFVKSDCIIIMFVFLNMKIMIKILLKTVVEVLSRDNRLNISVIKHKILMFVFSLQFSNRTDRILNG